MCPQYRSGAALLHEGIDAKAREIWHREREVAFEVFFVHLALVVAHDVVDHRMDILVLHWRQVDAPDVAMHANERWQAGREVQVGGLVLDREGQKFGDVHL